MIAEFKRNYYISYPVLSKNETDLEDGGGPTLEGSRYLLDGPLRRCDSSKYDQRADQNLGGG